MQGKQKYKRRKRKDLAQHIQYNGFQCYSTRFQSAVRFAAAETTRSHKQEGLFEKSFFGASHQIIF
jgi:hypothetical protein